MTLVKYKQPNHLLLVIGHRLYIISLSNINFLPRRLITIK